MEERLNRPSMRDLETALKAVGFPQDVRKILGAPFTFQFRSGRDQSILCGTITAVELDGPGKVRLFVSAPSILDRPIMYFEHSGLDWGARVKMPDDTELHGFWGKLTLLISQFG